MDTLCEYHRLKAKKLPANPDYNIKKSLKETHLKEGIRFDKNDEKIICNELGFISADLNRIKWSFGWTVVDDDTKTEHMLVFTNKERGHPWGFYEDWYTKVAGPRGFKGNELIGFYINPNTTAFHFKVLGSVN